MSRQAQHSSALASPVLVGAVTLLVSLIAVFLAYNANQGLPFVPTYELRIETPNAQRLVAGNEIREGGFRIGQISEIEAVPLEGGGHGAQIVAQLSDAAGPVPADSTVVIRPRSTLGLKYVELTRGSSDREIPNGGTLTALGDETIPPEFDDLFNTFDDETREAIGTNLETFGGGLAARGADLNRALASLPSLLRDLVPVMQVLSDPSTQLDRFVRELQETATVVAPVSDDLAQGFESMAVTFNAISRDAQAFTETLAEGPETLRTGIRELPRQRPFLRALADVSDEIQGTARQVRISAPPLAGALAAGTRTLPQTPPFNRNLDRVFRAARSLAESPLTNPTINGLAASLQTLRPTLRWVGPHITVCNYWNYWWTLLSDHISEEDSTGTVQRVGAKTVPHQDDSPSEFNVPRPANGEGADPVTQALDGDPVHMHAQPYGRAVDRNGNADCESGQRGYPRRLARVAPPEYDIVIEARTPGNQGRTFTGRNRVPRGQTFSSEPTGRAPRVTLP
jgi:ABC-type transporter Mla subunit MlaD